ncbi:helix-turn-helix transcriptional regulator [Delftia tsuruhatensis]|uniref:helix-turn-helix transcriptional regulator n=1 Tax=Bacteria TaxID=2 RepID=UPI000A6BA932
MVKKVRERKKMTRAQLANLLQISVSHLTRIEDGKSKISLKLAVRIAKTLDCTVNDL